MPLKTFRAGIPTVRDGGWRAWSTGIGICFLLGLSACGGHPVYAPVIEADISIERIPQRGVHTVRTGETLYAIAWRYGMDYRTLAEMNHIAPPWRVQPGESILLRTQSSRTVSKPDTHPKHSTPPKTSLSPAYGFQSGHWHWPAKGRLVGAYSSSNRGINISGQLGQAIVATAPGRVVYAGDGLRGYGNLIIIKHNNAWLSAYAWNKNILVQEGEWVKSGQKIATMGTIHRQRPMLHFEIRYNGKSVNPVRHLKGV